MQGKVKLKQGNTLQHLSWQGSVGSVILEIWAVPPRPGNRWTPLPLENACWVKNFYRAPPAVRMWRTKTPSMRGGSADRSMQLSRSSCQGFVLLHVRYRLYRRLRVLWKQGWETFQETLEFSLHFRCEFYIWIPNTSSHSCWFYLLKKKQKQSNMLVRLLWQQAASDCFTDCYSIYYRRRLFDPKSCPALKKSLSGYFVLWFAVTSRTKRSYKRRITVTAIMTIVILVLFECFKQSSI